MLERDCKGNTMVFEDGDVYWAVDCVSTARLVEGLMEFFVNKRGHDVMKEHGILVKRMDTRLAREIGVSEDEIPGRSDSEELVVLVESDR